MTSQYFNLYNARNEQLLIEDLYNEAIYLQGFEAYYIPLEDYEKRDIIFGEDVLKKFDRAYMIDVYLKDTFSLGEERDFFSKFGLEIKNNLKIEIARREFIRKIPSTISTRPKEGDLIFISKATPNKALYEIKFVNESNDLHQLGRRNPYSYELEIELFKYSNEEIDTGICAIDEIEITDNYNITYELGTGNGNFLIEEIVYQGANVEYANCTAEVNSWDGKNKIIKLMDISGVFEENVYIIGATSNAQYLLVNYDYLNVNQDHIAYNNKAINDESENYIVNEYNPLSRDNLT